MSERKKETQLCSECRSGYCPGCDSIVRIPSDNGSIVRAACMCSNHKQPAKALKVSR